MKLAYRAFEKTGREVADTIEAPSVAEATEKLRQRESGDADGVNQLRGVVEDIAYLGGVSIYHVRVSPGLLVEMTQANIHPRTEQALTWGQEVAMEWSPASGVVLTE